jgi:hypothetical protein
MWSTLKFPGAARTRMQVPCISSTWVFSPTWSPVERTVTLSEEHTELISKEGRSLLYLGSILVCLVASILLGRVQPTQKREDTSWVLSWDFTWCGGILGPHQPFLVPQPHFWPNPRKEGHLSPFVPSFLSPWQEKAGVFSLERVAFFSWESSHHLPVWGPGLSGQPWVGKLMAPCLLLILVLTLRSHVLWIIEMPDTPTMKHKHQKTLKCQVYVTLKCSLCLCCLYALCFH